MSYFTVLLSIGLFCVYGTFSLQAYFKWEILPQNTLYSILLGISLTVQCYYSCLHLNLHSHKSELDLRWQCRASGGLISRVFLCHPLPYAFTCQELWSEAVVRRPFSTSFYDFGRPLPAYASCRGLLRRNILWSTLPFQNSLPAFRSEDCKPRPVVPFTVSKHVCECVCHSVSFSWTLFCIQPQFCYFSFSVVIYNILNVICLENWVVGGERQW